MTGDEMLIAGQIMHLTCESREILAVPSVRLELTLDGF